MTDQEKLDAIRVEIRRLVDVRGYDKRMANDLFIFIDSLPNESISKDLEEDVDNILEKYDWNYDKIDFYEFAEHFYELGIKAQKENKKNKT